MAKQVSHFNPLALYNLFSAGLWGYLLFKVIFEYSKLGQPAFYESTKNSLTYVQLGALIEILNSLLGIVRAPLLTTLAQVASRLLIAVGIFQYVPDAPNARAWPYVSLISAWSATEVVRYLFYYFNLTSSSGAPVFLQILRYNMFWVLYPLGVLSELLIIYSALPLVETRFGIVYHRLLIVAMLTYIPGFPMLFTHMMVQRKKTMKALFSQKKKRTEKAD
ncbi:LAMI_0H07690g1_1 [Lachancea mirantina]|uniref:Very-long-chain (3R)-3-hydroxyacyl-CoA dehydratase n=1 Tax=Lachancea mirantina TaxID=1230905 RepID=A0A1G4KFV0_9SACH|nr:LAMI_0H07690g1_1 [Lachancea mirantina]